MLKKRLFYGAFFWTVLVTVLSLVSFRSAPKIIISLGTSDKAVHFVFYFVFVLLWGLYRFSWGRMQNRTFFYLFLLAITYGGCMEICQELFTQRRTADWYDMLANTIGALFGLIVLYLCSIYRTRKL